MLRIISKYLQNIVLTMVPFYTNASQLLCAQVPREDMVKMSRKLEITSTPGKCLNAFSIAVFADRYLAGCPRSQRDSHW